MVGWNPSFPIFGPVGMDMIGAKTGAIFAMMRSLREGDGCGATGAVAAAVVGVGCVTCWADARIAERKLWLGVVKDAGSEGAACCRLAACRAAMRARMMSA